MDDWITCSFSSEDENDINDIFIYKYDCYDTIKITSPYLLQPYYVYHLNKWFDYFLWNYSYNKYDKSCLIISKTNVLKMDFGICCTTKIKLNNAIDYLELLDLIYKLKLFVDIYIINDVYKYTIKLLILLQFQNNFKFHLM